MTLEEKLKQLRHYKPSAAGNLRGVDRHRPVILLSHFIEILETLTVWVLSVTRKPLFFIHWLNLGPIMIQLARI
jgi:hypothetical protein